MTPLILVVHFVFVLTLGSMANPKGFLGLGHNFLGEKHDLGLSYLKDRRDLVTPIGETGVTQDAPF